MSQYSRSHVYDNWGSLVAAVVRSYQNQQLCLADSRNSSLNSSSSSSCDVNNPIGGYSTMEEKEVSLDKMRAAIGDQHAALRNISRSGLVEIQPRELGFIIEVMKQSSCAVHIANVTNQLVAFKVKTTSPKKYTVMPNPGIIMPKSTNGFTVTMQAQKSLPSDMLCEDKFLIQSTVVPFITRPITDETFSYLFMENRRSFIKEATLQVALTSAPSSLVMLKKPHSPVLMFVDGAIKEEPSDESSIALSRKILKQEASYEALTPKEPHSPALLPVDGVAKEETPYMNLTPMHELEHGVEIPVPDMLMKNKEQIQNNRKMEESTSASPKIMEKFMLLDEDEEANDYKAKRVIEMEDIKWKLVLEDIEELKQMISSMEGRGLQFWQW